MKRSLITLSLAALAAVNLAAAQPASTSEDFKFDRTLPTYPELGFDGWRNDAAIPRRTTQSRRCSAASTAIAATPASPRRTTRSRSRSAESEDGSGGRRHGRLFFLAGDHEIWCANALSAFGVFSSVGAAINQPRLKGVTP